jgi:hypothetical protein
LLACLFNQIEEVRNVLYFIECSHTRLVCRSGVPHPCR